MGQKMPPPPRLIKDDPLKDVEGNPSSSARMQTRRLVGIIAEVLGVPPATMYEAKEGRIAADGDLDGECARLLQAYRSITNPAKRCRLLELVQAAAEKD